jgi:3-oxoacyl-[acyl-carrier protein] reductase
MDLSIADRVAIVGASSKGLGRACAEALAREGARVVICARHIEPLQRAAADIGATTGKEVLPLVADLTKKADIEHLVSETQNRWGAPDILVNNIGGPPPGGFLDHGEEAFQKAFERLLLYPLRIMKLTIPAMQQQRWGRIVNMTSMAVKEPVTDLVLSGVFRTGLISMCKALAHELAAQNVLINNVAPGAFETDRALELLRERSERTGRTVADLRAEGVKTLPMGRYLQPEELANVVAFLCSEHASAVTGTTIPIDGGGMYSLF